MSGWLRRRTFESNGLSRRELGRLASFLLLGGWVPSRSASVAGASAASGVSQAAADVYRALGVRPLINCRGTVTIIGGSIELPVVREAKSRANQHHVHLDELMEAAGKRLAELTRTEWGIVTAGCAAAISHATAACVAGGNPDLHVRIPNLAGFARNEVIIPSHSRTVYDAAVRAVGVDVIEVDSLEALELAIGPKTAMIYLRPNAENEFGPMPTDAIARIAAPNGIPILVDAAAEILTVPNVHLERGATLVCYSGGKVIRGPQSAGLLLGRKDLVRAAWVHSAPHHGYARSMKVGREEVIGMLAAVESWVTRDHEAEWKEWVGRCDYIADHVTRIPGVTASVQREPGHRNNRSARVSLSWDSESLGITGAEVADMLFNTEPRIALGGRARAASGGDTGISINAAMMSSGDEKTVADRVYQVLSMKHTPRPAATPAPPVGDVTGHWKVDIRFAAGRSTHTLDLVQRGNTVEGTHQGDFLARELTGTIDGERVDFATSPAAFHGDRLEFSFSGRLNGESMSGSLDMGEYQGASWSAVRRT